MDRTEDEVPEYQLLVDPIARRAGRLIVDQHLELTGLQGACCSAFRVHQLPTARDRHDPQVTSGWNWPPTVRGRRGPDKPCHATGERAQILQQHVGARLQVLECRLAVGVRRRRREEVPGHIEQVDLLGRQPGSVPRRVLRVQNAIGVQVLKTKDVDRAGDRLFKVEGKRHIDRIRLGTGVWMNFRIAQLAPCVRQVPGVTPDGVIHEVVRPLTRLPPERNVRIFRYDADGEPVDHGFLRRTLLSKGLLGVNLDIDLPDGPIAAGNQFFRQGIPPVLARLLHRVERVDRKLAQAKITRPDLVRLRM